MRRRDFIRHGTTAAAAGATLFGLGRFPHHLFAADKKKHAQDVVTLGRTGVKVTRLAQGTGTHGVGHSSNQIRGLGYLYTFGLVEEFILQFVLDHVHLQLNEDDYRVRAFLSFANEEAKHIQLFRRFREEFENGFGSPCGLIGPPDAVARAVVSHHPLAVSLAILHIEWMTQRHFLDSVQGDQILDPQFKSLLRHHWMEEVRHAKLDRS